MKHCVFCKVIKFKKNEAFCKNACRKTPNCYAQNAEDLFHRLKKLPNPH